ncbi:antibiotic transporter [Streptomyces noursei ZPM]|uniref:MFS transporter n=1 Tax=Streptomyces noursei TaxID=1971 RepID=A0A401QYW5_STRNR|nr:MFS transporter [Streptomyces noursei]AKA03324.1 antibiotic transporter [Streptomyces noursei ZPM]UWS71714.1 MFS transporter [Streptomyces noursei]GCB90564.1 MFS transporter [Streptomyces noursei]
MARTVSGGAAGVDGRFGGGGFGRLWSAAVVSAFGDALRGTALPLLAHALTADPLLIALVTACGFAPWLLFGLLGGAVADRVDQRRAMWAVDLLRGLLMGGFALAVAAGAAGIGLLLALAFALTTLQTLFDNAATALLPAVVPRAALTAANARLMTGQEVVRRFVGGPVAPVLIGVSVALPFLADAATYLLAAALVASLRTGAPPRPPAVAGRTLRREMAEGLRALRGDRVLRGFCLSVALGNVGLGALIAELVVVVKDWLGAGDFGYVAVTTGYGAGTVLGGLLAGRVIAALGGQLRTLLLAGAVQTVVLVGFGTVRVLWSAALALALFGFAGTVWNVLETTLVQQRAPEAMLGRISSAFRTVSIAGTPVGALLGGGAAVAWGPNSPALVAAALLGVGTVVLAPVVRGGDGTPSNGGQIPHTAP